MLTNEFELIQHFFNQEKLTGGDVIQGIGDDAAVLQLPKGQQLVVTTDTLLLDRHFPENTRADDIGYKALAVNLSDLAAMGAEPAWILLALTLPRIDEAWLTKFAQGFFSLLNKFHLQLVGGDVTQGPLSITIQAIGFIPAGRALLRSGAKPGDRIYVTGTFGDAGLALGYLQGKFSIKLNKNQHQGLMRSLNRPEPRLAIGLALRGIASSAIDVSDGLAADLGHILVASQVGATIEVAKIPCSETLQKLVPDQALQMALSAGDDYELCFTVPQSNEKRLHQVLKALNCSYACIGIINRGNSLFLQDENGHEFILNKTGFQHFN